jgi:type IX secretion system PorP/SprF family membrane protein
MKINMIHSYKIVHKNPVAVLLLAFFGVLVSYTSDAQLNPLGSMYYQNQYLANPAMAGSSDGLAVNLGYRKQWTSFPGAPATQYISGDYLFAEKAAAGVTVYNEKAGLMESTRILATYAYHLPLNTEGRKVYMGLSVGVQTDRIDMDALNGDIDDPSVARYNDRGAQFDGDFGIAYLDSKLTFQAVLPNMKAYLNQKEYDFVNRSLFFLAASYKFTVNSANEIGIEPKLVYRGIKGSDSVVDVGANLTFLDNVLNVYGIYHTTKNTTLGVGFKLKDMITITGAYSSASSTLGNATQGSFEAGLRISLLTKE